MSSQTKEPQCAELIEVREKHGISRLGMAKWTSISIAEIACIVAIGLYVLIFSYPFFFYVIDHNFREIVTYNMDSASQLRDVGEALAAPKFQLNFDGYGHFFYNLCIGLAFLYSKIAHLGENELFAIMRLVTWLGGVSSLAAVYVLVRRYLGWAEAVFASATLVAFPAVMLMFVDPHPDTWQMFFVTLSLYYSARAIENVQAVAASPDTLSSDTLGIRGDVWLVLAASAAAGAAFGTKYVGIMLLPLIAALAMYLPPIAIGTRQFGVLIRWLGFAFALLALPLIMLNSQISSDYLLALLPEWRSFPAKTLMNVARLLRQSALVLGIFIFAMAAAITAGVEFERYRAWFTRAGLLIAIGLVFVLTFVVTSPWDAYSLRFVPSIYGMSARVNTGQDLRQAPWGGPFWISQVTGGVGYLTFVLFLIGAVGLVRLAMNRKLSPLHFVLGWVGLFGGYLLIRVNMTAVQYLLPVAPAIAIIAACGVASVRKKLASIAPPTPAIAAIVVIAVLALSCQVLQNLRQQIAVRTTALKTELDPVQRAVGQWFSRCVPTDARIFPAPYTYIPPEITDVWFRSQGYEALRQFRPNLVMVRAYEEKFYLQAPELNSPTVMETGDDATKFYKVVLRSDEYVAGPQFDVFRAYLTPDLAKVVAGRGPDCVHP